MLVQTVNTLLVSYINHQGTLVMPTLQTGTPDSPVSPGQAALSESSVYPWVLKSESGYPVEQGAEVRGMETPTRGDGVDLEGVWPMRS